MQVRDEAEAVRPRVRRERPAAQVRERGDPPAPAEAAGEHRVGLHDVDAAAQDEVARLEQAAHHLAGRDAQRRAPAQQRVALDVVRAQRLLEPVDAERLERAGALGRGRDVPARGAVAGHAPALVGVDHDLDVRADRGAHRLDDLDVAAPVVVVEAQLHRAHAAVAQRGDAPRALLGRHGLAGRGVREQPLRASAEQPPQRLADQPPDEVPDRHLDRPRAPAVEVDGLEDLAHGLGPHRVDADEQAVEQRGVRDVVAARVAGDAVLRAHDDERRLDRRARRRVPRRAKRRVERDGVAAHLDAGDPGADRVGRGRRRRRRCARSCRRSVEVEHDAAGAAVAHEPERLLDGVERQPRGDQPVEREPPAAVQRRAAPGSRAPGRADP